ncbi:MAG: hypothetical protein R3D52_15230 [Xanthobacteraceae bacterium]
MIQISTASWTKSPRLNLPGDVSFNAPTAYGQFTNNLLATDDGGLVDHQRSAMACSASILARLTARPSDDLLRAAPERMSFTGMPGTTSSLAVRATTT